MAKPPDQMFKQAQGFRSQEEDSPVPLPPSKTGHITKPFQIIKAMQHCRRRGLGDQSEALMIKAKPWSNK